MIIVRPGRWKNLIVMVNDGGVFEVRWRGKQDTIETINENVQIKDFNEIFEIFKKNIMLSSVWADSFTEKVEINIESIELGLIRVPIENETR